MPATDAAEPARQYGADMLMRMPGWLTDMLIVLVVGTAAVAQAFHTGGLRWLTLPLALAAAVALVFRNRRPLAVLAVVTFADAVLVLAGGAWMTPAVLFAVFTVAARCERRTSLRAAAAVTAVLAVPMLKHSHWASGSRSGP